jgi:hypothetical protein
MRGAVPLSASSASCEHASEAAKEREATPHQGAKTTNNLARKLLCTPRMTHRGPGFTVKGGGGHQRTLYVDQSSRNTCGVGKGVVPGRAIRRTRAHPARVLRACGCKRPARKYGGQKLRCNTQVGAVIGCNPSVRWTRQVGGNHWGAQCMCMSAGPAAACAQAPPGPLHRRRWPGSAQGGSCAPARAA